MSKKSFVVTCAVLFALFLGFCAYQYHALPSHFLLGGLRFQFTDNILVTPALPSVDYSTQMGEAIGVVEEQVYLYPAKDGQGFKVPAGSVVYREKGGQPEPQYTVILQTPQGNLYRGSIYMKNSADQAKVLTQFDEQFG